MAKTLSAESKTRKDRVEFLRNHIDNESVKLYVSMLDAVTSRKELRDVKAKESEVINCRQELDLSVRYALSDAEWECEDRLSREAKEADKKRIAEAKAARTEAKDAISATLRRYLGYPMLVEAIKTVAETFRPDLFNSFFTYKRQRLEKFIIDNKRVEVPEPIWEGRGKRDSINNFKLLSYNDNIIFVSPYHVKGELRANYIQMIETEAKNYAEMVLEELRCKLAFKLGPVIDRKGGGEVRPMGNADQHAIYITFPDHSEFTVRSQIVHAVSKNHVFFSRHPMTFHNVVFADGSKMKTPSAEKMKQEFGIVD